MKDERKIIVKKMFQISYIFLVILISQLFSQDSIWIKIDDGLFYTDLNPAKKSIVGDSRITIIRIDPKLYSLKLLTADELNENNLTVQKWVEKYNLICAINAGMFQIHYKSNVGYMKNYKHLNNPKIKKEYFSIAAFNPMNDGSPEFKIFDSDATNIKKIINSYNTVIQNLRLIKHPGKNRWSQQKKRWSEAALGQDKDGSILFIFSRSPYSMHDLNNILLRSSINLVCAQHLEGGPEASLYLNHNDVVIKQIGSYETDFFENDDNNQFWSVPNVIGIVKN